MQSLFLSFSPVSAGNIQSYLGWRAGVPLLQGQAKRVGAIQPGEEKAPG